MDEQRNQYPGSNPRDLTLKSVSINAAATTSTMPHLDERRKAKWRSTLIYYSDTLKCPSHEKPREIQQNLEVDQGAGNVK